MLYALPCELKKSVQFSEGLRRKRNGEELTPNPTFTISAMTASEMLPLFGEQHKHWNVFVVGTGVRYEYLLPLKLMFRVMDESDGVLCLKGLSKYNEVGNEQWNDRRERSAHPLVAP